jgi:UDPglucose 6-dehydrogenase
VYCIDIDESNIQKMKNGICPIYETDLQSLMVKNSQEEKLKFTTDYNMAFDKSHIIIIAIGTPETTGGAVNLDYVYSAALQIAKTIKNDTLIVIKSTVPVGTNDEIEKLIKENLVHKVKVEVASNPEFLSQGTAVSDTLNASRIVIGVENSWAEVLLKEVYEPFGQPIVVTDRRSAEMIKYASNDFLALKISFMNDIANLCEIVGANIEEVAKGMSYDERIGSKFLKVGVGYGGSCFPKDTRALHWLACDHDYELKTVRAAIEVNENQKMKLIKKVQKVIKNFKGIKLVFLD